VIHDSTRRVQTEHVDAARADARWSESAPRGNERTTNGFLFARKGQSAQLGSGRLDVPSLPSSKPLARANSVVSRFLIWLSRYESKRRDVLSRSDAN
jgi:hypothetical protein